MVEKKMITNTVKTYGIEKMKQALKTNNPHDFWQIEIPRLKAERLKNKSTTNSHSKQHKTSKRLPLKATHYCHSKQHDHFLLY